MKNKESECKIFKIQLFQIESDVTAAAACQMMSPTE